MATPEEAWAPQFVRIMEGVISLSFPLFTATLVACMPSQTAEPTAEWLLARVMLECYAA